MANTERYIASKDLSPTLTVANPSPHDLTDSRRGWLVVSAAFVGLFLSMGVLVVYTFGVLAKAMAEDLGLSITELSAVFMVFSLAVVVAGPFWGAPIELLGSKVLPRMRDFEASTHGSK